MNYNFTTITSIAACDASITNAQSEKSMLVYKRDKVFASVNSTTEHYSELQEELASANARIAELNTLMPTFAEGSDERSIKEEELYQLMSDRSGLTRKLNNQVRDRQYVLGQYEARIAETDVFITALQSHKNGLTA